MKQLKTSTGAFTKYGAQIASKVKKANQRLRQLEKKNLTTSGSYRYVQMLGLQDNYVGFSKDGKLKFTTNVKKLSDEQAEKLNDYVDAFLESKSSTVSGYKDLHEENKKIVEVTRGETLTYAEWDYIWASGIMRVLKNQLSSSQMDETQRTIKTANMSIDEAIQFLTEAYHPENKKIIDTFEEIEAYEKKNTLKDMTFKQMQQQFIGTI